MIPPPKKPKKIPGEQPDQGHEAVHHDQGEGYYVINNPNILEMGVFQYLMVSRRCPYWDKNPISH